MGGGYYSYESIPSLVESGKLSESVLDTAVSRVLRAKFKLGLFENPYTGVADDDIFKYINTPAHKKIARQLDSESIVLLENHENVLPLKKNANIAVIGPMAHGYVNVSNTLYSSSFLSEHCSDPRLTVVWRLCDSHSNDPRRYPP